MNGGYSSVYFRKTFNVSNLSALTSLLLETRYDDGINVWINGHYVANANVSAENLAYKATAISSIEADELVPFTINNPASYLVAFQRNRGATVELRQVGRGRVFRLPIDRHIRHQRRGDARS